VDNLLKSDHLSQIIDEWFDLSWFQLLSHSGRGASKDLVASSDIRVQ
jgi:hypothetical protein